ncbi:MAG: ABC transporter ATP-binding protein [Emergencia sp.]
MIIVKEPDRMRSYWMKEWKVALAIAVTGIIYNGALELGPILQGKVIDLIAQKAGNQLILKGLALYLGAICLIQGSRFLKRYYVRVFANRTSMSMRKVVYRNIIRRDMEQLQEENTGDLMTRAVSDVGACVEGMRKFTTEVFDTGVLMAAYFITLLCYDVKLTIGSCLFILPAVFFARQMKTVIYRYTKDYRNQLSHVSSVTLENVENQQLYRLSGVLHRREEAYDRELADLKKKAVRASVLENSMQPVYRIIALIGLVIVVFQGGQKVLDGSWSIGSFSAYVTIFYAFAIKVSRVAKLFNAVQKAQVSWQRVKPYLKDSGQTGETQDTAPDGEKEDASRRGPVSLQVSGLSSGIVRNVDFSVETGQFIGVTGPVASGKSTVGKVLQGLYPYEGSITINGKELAEMTPAEISGYVTYMGHDSQLLSDTIYDNITLGRDGDISRVLADVCFDEDLGTMPDGIHTMVGSSGIRLSGGQQARLSLARTLYHRSRILVLDDPFAAVDVETEQKIMRNLRRHYGDCALILISHRVTAFDEAEMVLLIDGEKTVFDTHSSLMRRSEVYQEIFRTQKEVYHV